MRACILATLLLFAVCFPARAANPWVVYEGKEGPGKGKHIVLIAGDQEYRSEEMIPQLARILARHHGYRCTVLFTLDRDGTINPGVSNIPGLEKLREADLCVMFLRFLDLPDEQMKHIVDYIEAGKPVIGLRTSTHAFALNKKSKYARWDWRSRDWPGGFGKQVLGETWVNHHGRHGSQSTRGILAPEAKAHPILRGIKDGEVWGPTDVYTVKLPLSGDSKPLLLGQVVAGMKPTDPALEGPKNDPMMPIAWVKTYEPAPGKKARIFTSTMASSQDFENEAFRRLLVNACYWAVGREGKIPEKSKVDLVGTYRPTPFKTGGFKRGVKPEDLKLD